MIKPEKLDAGTTLKGLDYIDVPGSSKRDYKLNFFAHKEGTFGAKVSIHWKHCGTICKEAVLLFTYSANHLNLNKSWFWMSGRSCCWKV